MPKGDKYSNLATYLKDSGEERIIRTFGEIEDILGFPLSPFARKYQWANNNGRSISWGWLLAGYVIEDCDMNSQKVTFRHNEIGAAKFINHKKNNDKSRQELDYKKRSDMTVNVSKTIIEYHSDWFWEGNVQKTVCDFLETKGYTIKTQADTKSHENGIDIDALTPSGLQLWISVKGYPSPKGSTTVTGKIKTTAPSTQAKHWFINVVYDMVRYRSKNKEVLLALALPRFPCYINKIPEIDWLMSIIPFGIYWVDNEGNVTIDKMQQ